NRPAKTRELMRILDQEPGSIMIFTRTKANAVDLWRRISSRGYRDSSFLSSDKAQKDREKTLEDFRSGRVRILVTTDVAGRGIHVDGVAHVINFDFPDEPEDYVHRVGRTGRNERTGQATTFVTPEDVKLLVQ